MATAKTPGSIVAEFCNRSAFLVFLTSCFLLLTPCFVPPTHATVHHSYTEKKESPLVDEAEADFVKNDFAAAEKKLNQVVKDDAADYRAWYDLGFAERSLGKNAEAVVAYKKAIELKPDLFEAQLNLGFVLAATGDVTAAESALKQATTLKPQNDSENNLARAWLGLAHLQQKDQPREALASVREALKHSPKNSAALLLAGQLEQANGDDAGAQADYRKILDQGETEDKTAALSGLIQILVAQGKLADCEQLIRQNLAEMSPEQLPALSELLGRVLLKEGKLEDAQPLLEEAHQAAPGDDKLTRDLAGLYSARKDNSKAASLYAQLVTSAAQDASLHYEYGRVLLQLHRFAEAQAELLTTVKLSPQDGQAYSELAVCANENKDYILVLRALQERAKFLPETPGTYFLRATAYDYLKDYPHATDNYKLFLAASNGSYPDQEWQARHRLKAIEKLK